MKRYAIRAAAVSAAVIACVCFTWQRQEPHYSGKRLSQWLRELDMSGSGDLERRAQAAQALKSLGTNALPRLTSMLCAQDSAPKRFVIQMLSKQPVLHFHFRSARQTQTLGVQGYQALGEIAAQNLPLLIGLMNNPSSTAQTKACIALVLGNMGPVAKPAIPTLARAAQDSDPEVRLNAMLALANIHQNTDPGGLMR